MNIYKLVLKDILRRKKRVLYAALGVIIGTMTVVSILTVAAAGQARIIAQLEKYGPNLTILPAVSNLNMTLGDLSLGALSIGDNYIDEGRLPEIRTITDGEIRKALKSVEAEGNIATIAPKLYVNAAVNGTNVLVVGVIPEEERLLRTWWKVEQGGYISGMNDILAGASASELLGIKAGDEVSVGNVTFKVTGILEMTGSNDDYQLFATLSTVQQATGKEGKVSSIDIRALCNACPVEIIADALNGAIPGLRAVAVKQVAETEMGMLDRINRLMYALAGITLAIGAFGVMNTMMTSVHGRIKDIGIMRAVGSSQRQIIAMFLEEAVIVGVLGGVFGYVCGSLLAYVIGPLIFEGTAVTWVLRLLPVSLAVAIAVAMLATSYPAYRATRIRVADSFRSL
ncbi:MAG: ABC transporter permease [Dehalococcoidia bacterium]|nr:MAG: ABC transporter permease [Dehalococcoidia bacterium]